MSYLQKCAIMCGKVQLYTYEFIKIIDNGNTKVIIITYWKQCE